MNKFVWLFSLFGILIMSCKEKADVLILNGKVWTVDEKQSIAEAVAIKGDKILAVGWSQDMKGLVDQQTEIIDVEGKLVLPGFNDAHLHFLGGGLSLLQVNLTECKTPAEVSQKITKRASELPEGNWITGRGWDQTLFNNGEWPNKELLDMAAPKHPVFVRRVDGHVGWANSLALRIAGIDRSTVPPSGGEILLDTKGEPTGIVEESALDLIEKVIPKVSAEQKLLAIEKALALARRCGITSIQDNSDMDVVKIYRNLYQQGKLTIRVSEWLDFKLAEHPAKLLRFLENLRGDEVKNFLRIGQLKGYLDGTLGSRTAYFFEPYDDDPSTVGLPQYTQAELDKMIATADSLGMQVGLHAIGAKANWMALNAFEKSIRQNAERPRRHRIEHAQVLRLSDIPRFAELGVIASMQPTHCTSDLRWAEQRIGHERCLGAYAWRRLLDSDAKLAFGTDWPVEPLDPMRGIYSAVTRKNIETGLPDGGWFPDQTLSVAEAVRCYTLEAAYAEFQENMKGSISPGKLADLVVLSRDIFSVPPREILDTHVVMTVLGGMVVYRDQK
jgi:predicted amidohydrolase YtcJ